MENFSVLFGILLMLVSGKAGDLSSKSAKTTCDDIIDPVYVSIYSSDLVQPSYDKLIIPPVTRGVSQVRVDFLNLSIPGPDEDGNCLNGNVTFSSQINNAPVICGNNDNQHVYLEFDSNLTPLRVDIFTNNDPPSSYQVKVTQIECSDAQNLSPRKPNGEICLQYFNGTKGQVGSFNYLGGQHLANQDYSICLSPSCTNVTWSETYMEIDIDNMQTGNLGPCSTDYIKIANAEVMGFHPEKICGPRTGDPGLNFQATNGPPAMEVYFDKNETNENSQPIVEGTRGFYLSYTCA